MFSSAAQSCLTPCNHMNCTCQGSLSVTNPQSLLKLLSIESVMPSSHLILCHPFSSCLLSFPASGCFPVSQFSTSGGQRIGVSASASVLPMNSQNWFLLGLTGLISAQGTLKNLLQHHSSKASIQGIFTTQGLNPGLPHCRQILYQLSHKGSPENQNQKVKRAISMAQSEALIQLLISCIFVIIEVTYPNCGKFES